MEFLVLYDLDLEIHSNIYSGIMVIAMEHVIPVKNAQKITEGQRVIVPLGLVFAVFLQLTLVAKLLGMFSNF